MSAQTTGGAYSVYRACLGLTLGLCLALRLPGTGAPGALPTWLERALGAPAAGPGSPLVAVLVAVGVIASLALAVGARDRAPAVVLGCVWMAFVPTASAQATLDHALPGLLPWLHLALPSGARAPFGAWTARGRLDPGGGWRLPGGVVAAVWLALAAGTALRGAWMLAGEPAPPARAVAVLLLAFPLLALARGLRHWAWGALLALVLAGTVLPALAAPPLTWALVLLLAFDPRWVPPRRARAPELVFYDGACGLCHRIVRLVLAEDPDGSAFRFAPLQGETFASEVAEEARAGLSDSVVVRRADGRLLERSDAVAHLLRGLGGIWGVLGWLLRAVPRPLRDACYAVVARVRRRLFAAPDGPCPLLPPALGARFLP